MRPIKRTPPLKALQLPIAINTCRLHITEYIVRVVMSNADGRNVHGHVLLFVRSDIFMRGPTFYTAEFCIVSQRATLFIMMPTRNNRRAYSRTMLRFIHPPPFLLSSYGLPSDHFVSSDTVTQAGYSVEQPRHRARVVQAVV